MADWPKQRPAGATAETSSGVAFAFERGVLQVELGDVPVYAPHSAVLWRTPGVELIIKPGTMLQKSVESASVATPVFLVQTQGRGRAGFARNAVGTPFAIHLPPGARIDVRQDQLLAATTTVEYTWQELGPTTWGTGVNYMDTFWTTTQPGVLWLFGNGDVLELTLGAGETIDVFSTRWLYKDASVSLELAVKDFGTPSIGGLVAALSVVAAPAQLGYARMTGPGRVGLQTLSGSALSTSL